MSAFVVEPKTINGILTWFERDAFSNERRVARWLLEEAHFDPMTATGLAGLGMEMHRLNIYAVDARYGDGEGREMTGEPYSFAYTDTPNDVQALKSLQCWLYQCSEGDCPDRPLYQLMRDVERNMMHRIIGSMPEYRAADWG